jgi:hypothetical protein
MKKFGIFLFFLALIVGVLIANVFSFGRIATGDLFTFNFSFKRGIVGSGNVAAEKRDLKDFTSINVSGIIDVDIRSQGEYSVVVEADDNLIPKIRTEASDGVLKIWSEGSIRIRERTLVRISAPYIEKVVSSGVTKVNVVSLDNSSFEIESSGATKVSVSGETQDMKIGVSGAGKIDAEHLSSKIADVFTSGACKVKVNVSDELRAKASGASKIHYSGSPKIVVEKRSGASKIRPL